MDSTLISIQSFSDKLFNSVLSAKEDCSNDNLHSLRLNLKTIKTLCAFYESQEINEEKQSNLFLPFRKLFKHAGRLRDNHQLEKKLKHYFTEDGEWVDELKNALKEKRDKQEEKFINRANKFAYNEAEEVLDKVGLCLNLPRGEVIKKFKQFSTEQMSVIEKMLLVGTNSEQLHTIRRLLKQIFLLHKFLKIQNDKKNIIPQIDHLQDELGALHDNELLFDFADKNLNDNKVDDKGLHKRLRALDTMIEKLRIDCLKKLSLLVNISHF